MSLVPHPTEWLQDTRFVIVSVDLEGQTLRVRGARDACSELSCGQDAIVVSDDGSDGTLRTLNPGDIVKLETLDSGATRIAVLRRAWEEYASPEL